MAKAQESKVNTQENTQGIQTTNEQNNLKTSSQENTGQTGLAHRDAFAPSFFGADSGPFALMRRFREEMDRLFEDFGFGRNLMPSFGNDLFSRTFGNSGNVAMWSPQVEMFERDGKLIVRADLPGMSKDDVKVEVTDNALTISGERHSENEDKREGFYRSERSYGSFLRRIPLPDGVNADDANATVNNGVLEITMQAPQRKSSGRKLEIKESK